MPTPQISTFEQLKNFINENLPDNISGIIDPLDIRTSLLRLIDTQELNNAILYANFSPEQTEVWNTLIDKLEQIQIGNNLGLIKTTDTPPATGKYRGDVATAGTYTNFKNSSGVALAFTQLEIDENFCYIYLVDNVATKVVTEKRIPSGAEILNPIDDSQIPSSKATADFLKNSQNIVLRKGTVAEIQENIDYEADGLAIVFNEQNPNNNGIYKKISGVGSGGWEKTNFINPLHHKKVTPTTANDTESLAIGGGHTSIFQDELGTGQGHTAFGFEAGLGIGNCWATTLVGWKAGRALSNKSVVNTWTGLLGNTGNSFYGYNAGSIANGALDCSFFGTAAGQNLTTGMDNCGFGIWSLRLIEAGSENAGFGHLSLGFLVGKGSFYNIDSLITDISNPLYSWGHRNVGVGDKAGALDNGGNELSYVKKCVYVGCKTTGSSNYVVNENVFGYMAQGRGSDTVSIGNNEIKETHFHGILANWTDRRFADLPIPNRSLLGARSFILDANTRAFDTVVSGGGSNNMPVWCDGSVWRVG